MSPELLVVSGKEAIKVFQKIGYIVVREKSSHIRLRDKFNSLHKPLTVPNHKEIKPGLLKKPLRDTNLTTEDFTKLLKK